MMLRRSSVLAVAMACLLMGGIVDAQARAGSGFSFGSRGARSYSTVPSTPTAPRVSPFNGGPGYSNPGYGNQNLLRPGVGSRGLFGGFGRGFLGGLLGAGLIGLLFGHGLFGGLGGFFSVIGFVIQIALLVLLVRFAIGFFRSRNSLAGATAGAGPSGAYRTMPGGPQGGAAPSSGPTAAPATTPLAIDGADYAAFEALLAASQKAYSAEDVAILRGLTTPEMAAEFERELADNKARGVINRISDVRLVRGDLAESWREPNAEYATTAMNFSLVDAMVDRATGRVVAGDANRAQEVTEAWTFVRAPGSGANGWRLSAIQQAG
jgi:predicted lipid-binding transport protein (Tim44 family)